MDRRRLLALGGTTSSILLAGCLQPPVAGGGPPSDGVSVSVTARADQPSVPVAYGVGMATARATDDRPARVRVSITNPTDGTVILGEERAVAFHHVASADEMLYLHPADEGGERGPVDPGCWRLTDHVAVPEYYGTVAVAPGETVEATSYVYGHPDLPEGTCLPTGDHRIRTTGVAGDDEAALDDGSDLTEFEWGFTLRVDE